MTAKTWRAGQHCWLDLMTSDLEGAKGFYGELLGWGFKEAPMPGGAPGVYTMATLGDGELGGLSEINAEQKAMGMPPNWSVYTLVKDVDTTTAAAKEAGGGAMVEPFDIPDTGRMAVLAGPGGGNIAGLLGSRALANCS